MSVGTALGDRHAHRADRGNDAVELATLGHVHERPRGEWLAIGGRVSAWIRETISAIDDRGLHWHVESKFATPDGEELSIHTSVPIRPT